MTGARIPHPWLTLAGIILLAANMRAAIAGAGPLVPDIRADLGLSRTAVSLLTTLPVLCFGLLATGAAALGRRIGSERTLLLAMLGIAAGSTLRYVPSTVWLLVGTALIGAAIAAANVLVPTVVKQYFPGGSSTITGVYTAALIAGATTASGVAAPLAGADSIGWRGALLAMAVPAVIAALVWAPQVRRTHHPPEKSGVRVLQSKVMWALAAFMGMQSLLYFTLIAWLPALLRDTGVSATNTGVALAAFNLFGVVSALGIPALAGRLHSQVPAVLAICVAWTVALAGLYALPGLYLLWSALAGLAQGAGISLALTLIVLRARTADVSRSLSGTVQGIGYLVAAVGPFAMGALRDVSAGWGVPLAALGVATALMAVTAPWSAGPRQVG